MNLYQIITPYIKAENTCQQVIEYFEKGNEPIFDDYIQLANYFMDENSKHDPTDVLYKQWIKEIFKNNSWKESVVLQTLLEECYNNDKDKLETFIFKLEYVSPRLNQKWHFFISYWAYREFVTCCHPKCKIPEITNPNNVRPTNPFRWCVEGKIWYEYARVI